MTSTHQLHNACCPCWSLHRFTSLSPSIYSFAVPLSGFHAAAKRHLALALSTFSHLAINDALNLPRYSARDIFVLEKFPGIGYIAKVLANGLEVCCKVGKTIHGKAVQREYESLQSISLSKYAFSIRVPKVFALVVDDYGVIGILEEFIPSEYTLGKILGHAVAPDSERRNKWAQQVKQTVYQLHEIGVVWGDGKPENILIDSETDDAWLIDFGGSFTDGWVDVELKETLDGDEQALRKTTQALDIGDENVESDRVIEDGVAEGLNEKVSMADANARPEPSHARLPFALDYS